MQDVPEVAPYISHFLFRRQREIFSFQTCRLVSRYGRYATDFGSATCHLRPRAPDSSLFIGYRERRRIACLSPRDGDWQFCKAAEYRAGYYQSHSSRSALHVAATYLDPGGFGDSRQCLKEGGSTPQTPITGNHLDVPRSLDPNPNLLSPEILTQRRGQSLYDDSPHCRIHFRYEWIIFLVIEN